MQHISFEPMNKLSFEIKTSKDFLKKLVEEVNEFESNISSSRYAINAAMTAWHLIDWVYYEFEFKTKFEKLSDFQTFMKSKYPKFQIVHDISNGTKHFKLNRHSSSVDETKLKQGSFNNDFSRDFDISRLQVVYNGETFDFINELESIRDFWIEYFKIELKQSL